MIRTGLIGCGSFGGNHLRVLKEIDPPLIGVCDTDTERVEPIAVKAGIPFFPDMEELIDRCDALVVAVPTIHHRPVAAAALTAGTHVLVEKPIAATVMEAEELSRLAAETGRILAVGHIERHNPAVHSLFDFVTDPHYAAIERLSPFTKRSLDIDVVLDLMIHDLQIVLELAGESPDDVRALGIPVLSDRVDMATAHISFPSGFQAHVTASRVSDTRVRKLRLFHGSAYTSVDYADRTMKGYRLVETSGEQAIEPLAPTVEDGEPLRREIEDFLAACRGERRPTVDGAAGTEALRLASVIQEVIDAT